MELNYKLKIIRDLAKLSQAEFGKLFGVSDKTISKWEQNNGSPTIESLKLIAYHFNISLDYLIDDKPLTKMDRELKEDIEEYERNRSNFDNFDELIKRCIELVKAKDILLLKEDYPVIKEDKSIDYKAFKIEDNKLDLNKDYFIKNRRLDIIDCLYKDELSFDEALVLGETRYLDIVYFRDQESNKSYKGRAELEDKLNNALSKLYYTQINYFNVLVWLIDHHARYFKDVPFIDEEEKLKIHKEPDLEKTVFNYKVAKRMIELEIPSYMNNDIDNSDGRGF